LLRKSASPPTLQPQAACATPSAGVTTPATPPRFLSNNYPWSFGATRLHKRTFSSRSELIRSANLAITRNNNALVPKGYAPKLRGKPVGFATTPRWGICPQTPAVPPPRNTGAEAPRSYTEKTESVPDTPRNSVVFFRPAPSPQAAPDATRPRDRCPLLPPPSKRPSTLRAHAAGPRRLRLDKQAPDATRPRTDHRQLRSGKQALDATLLRSRPRCYALKHADMSSYKKIT
jgi:hypothetical protein